jgi:hypothetical protein
VSSKEVVRIAERQSKAKALIVEDIPDDSAKVIEDIIYENPL